MSRVSGAVGRVRGSALGVTAGLIGWFVLVELASGILQGYYVPLLPDIVVHLGIRDADVRTLHVPPGPHGPSSSEAVSSIWALTCFMRAWMASSEP